MKRVGPEDKQGKSSTHTAPNAPGRRTRDGANGGHRLGLPTRGTRCFSVISERDRRPPLCGRDHPRFEPKRGRARDEDRRHSREWQHRTGRMKASAPLPLRSPPFTSQQAPPSLPVRQERNGRCPLAAPCARLGRACSPPPPPRIGAGAPLRLAKSHCRCS